ncbi:polar amino acid transport system permease protein [Propionibacterium cyclohexanicum]|uniref:Polar amino acid transport system permease protein n=1 Tax=Propionibacterium cyclohexanicum TaxID=64702 RepID=A0A1H9RZV6_9ACTN|nr:amino acid ABC transporter permease [Propionibacterium cyclohexanicum]SER77905.1 polar amino acid transport system permease protein [Propionibacterium cyclohexanicum]
MQYSPDWSVVGQAMPMLLNGLLLSVWLTVIVIVIGLVGAIPVALARMSDIWVIRYATQIYIEIFRCTPLLIQLFWAFYALPILLNIKLPGIAAAIVALSLNLVAYMAEAYRAGFQAIPPEQLEAAEVLQLPRLSQVVHIIFPQAFRQQLPSILSLLINSFKDTVLVSTIGVADLMFQANTASQHYYRPLEIFTTAAGFYFVIAFPVSLIVNSLERRSIRRRENA